MELKDKVRRLSFGERYTQLLFILSKNKKKKKKEKNSLYQIWTSDSGTVNQYYTPLL